MSTDWESTILSTIIVWMYFNRHEKQHLKLPWDIEDAKKLGQVLDRYKDRYFTEVLGGIFITYILYPLLCYLRSSDVLIHVIYEWSLFLFSLTCFQPSNFCHSRVYLLINTLWISISIPHSTRPCLLLFSNWSISVFLVKLTCGAKSCL